MTDTKLAQVKSIMRDEVLSIDGVTGIGYREAEGKVIVTVEKDSVKKKAIDEIGRSVAGYSIEYNVIGSPSFLFNRKGKVRPVVGGVSIGNEYITAGTLGYVPNFDGSVVGLSNNHVLTPSSNDIETMAGQDIYQPGPADGGSNTDKIGELKDWIGYKDESLNYMDAAIYEPTKPHSSTVIGEDGEEVVINGVASISEDDEVWKAGRTTGYTEGYVKYTNHDVKVTAGSNHPDLTFADQIVIGDKRGDNYKFVSGGDSGSLLLNSSNEVVGLVFAGSVNQPYIGIATPITYVQDVFDLDFGGGVVNQAEMGFDKVLAGATLLIVGGYIYNRYRM